MATFGMPVGYTLQSQTPVGFGSNDIRCVYTDPFVPARPAWENICDRNFGCCPTGCCATTRSVIDSTKTGNRFGIPANYSLLYSTEIDQTDNIRCTYGDAQRSGLPLYEYTCGRLGGCCAGGCCPSDRNWIGGIIVLCVFVFVVFVTGAIIFAVCFVRSRSKEKEAMGPERSYPASVVQTAPPASAYGYTPQPALTDQRYLNDQRYLSDQRYNPSEFGGTRY